MIRVEEVGAALGGIIGAASRHNLQILVALAVFGVLCLGALAFRERRPPYRRGRFLTANEKCFLRILDEAVGKDYRVFAQVRLADMVEVDLAASDAKRRAAMRKVFGKSVDFLICVSATFEPVAAIEVDDRSHLFSHRRERDALVNAVFAEIGMPLLRAPARRRYSVVLLRKMLADAGVDCGPAVFRGMERL